MGRRCGRAEGFDAVHTMRCRAACAATAAINSPLRLGDAAACSSLLVLINAPQDSTTAEVGRAQQHTLHQAQLCLLISIVLVTQAVCRAYSVYLHMRLCM